MSRCCNLRQTSPTVIELREAHFPEDVEPGQPLSEMTKRKLTNVEILSLRRVRDVVRETLSDKREVDEEIAKGNPKLAELIESIEPWAELYSHSFPQLLALFFDRVGWLQRLREVIQAAEVDSVKQAMLEELTDEAKMNEIIESVDSRNDEEKSEIFRVLMAVFWNQEAIRRYHEPMNELVSRAETDKEALLKAVAVDRSAVANSRIAKVIGRAQIRDDAPFMALLAKSVTRTKPIRKPLLDETRLMIEVINDLVGLQFITQDHLTELLVNELEVYPGESSDPESSVKKLIQKRNKQKGKSDRD